MEMIKIKNNRVLICIIAAAFAVSAAYSFYFQIKPKVDAKAYDIIAMNVAMGRGYWETVGAPIAFDHAVVRVGPLYELILAVIYKIFGHHYGIVWIWQALLHAGSALLLYLIARKLFEGDNGRKIGLAAAAIFSFYPDLVESSAMLMLETLYLFLLLLAAYLFFRFFENCTLRRAAVLGMVFALAVSTRPPVLFIVPPVIYFFFKKFGLKGGLRRLAVFGVAALLIFAPWTIRNYIVFHKIIPMNVAGAYNFWIGNFHGADGEQGAAPEILKFFETHSIVEIQDESVRKFTSFVAAYPGEFVKLILLRVNKYWSVIRPMGFWGYFDGWKKALFIFSSAVASVFLFCFGFFGAWRSLKMKNEKLCYWLWFALLTPLILYITVVETRYRFQIYPFLAVFAGLAIVERPKFWRDKYFWFGCGLIFLNGLIDLILSWERVKERFGLFF
jgi:4-amino-4-deoxy-L-arabinose transferase-like glycosyltransferase